jgi:hypothetical protein
VPKTCIEEKIAFSTKSWWENWITTCRRLKLDPYLSPFTKINSKWIKDLDVKHETLKLLEENIRKILEDIGIGNTVQALRA